MKLFTAEQIRVIDQATIQNEAITSDDLMERAANALFEAFVQRYEAGVRVMIFAGSGNNGGDGLALARLLAQLKSSYNISVFVLPSEHRSVDNDINLKRLLDELEVSLLSLDSSLDFPQLDADDVVVDALFGTGLSRPVEGLTADLIDYINDSDVEVFAIDIPSGMYAENNDINTGVVIRANYTVSFQFPKLSFLLSDSSAYLSHWEVRDIGLCQGAIVALETSFCLLTDEEALDLFHRPQRFAHKRMMGHALIVAGKKGMMGAAVLAGRACLRSGVGLLTSHVPSAAGDIIQLAVPEALLSLDRSELMFTDEIELAAYDAVGVGPALGTKPNAQQALFALLKNADRPLVVDADALNILSLNPSWLSLLPSGSILTPHPKEFDRLTQSHVSAYERLQSQIAFAQKWQVVVVLKGAFSSVALPDGTCCFNSTGNPGMATAGSGDVLTGIITGLLAQGYAPDVAASLGVWWHGKAGDKYIEDNCMSSLMASDLIAYMPRVELP